MRKLSAALVAVLFSAQCALAANLPLLSGSQFSEPSQVLASLNTLIQSINSGVAGEIGASPTQATTTVTTIQALGTVTIPAGTLATAGQAVRAKCFGSGTATGTNTLSIQVGGSTLFNVAGTATTAGALTADVMVMKTGANTQQILSYGQFNATPTAQTIVSGTNTDTAAINIVCFGTTTTIGQFTLNGMVVEQVK